MIEVQFPAAAGYLSSLPHPMTRGHFPDDEATWAWRWSRPAWSSTVRRMLETWRSWQLLDCFKTSSTRKASIEMTRYRVFRVSQEAVVACWYMFDRHLKKTEGNLSRDKRQQTRNMSRSLGCCYTALLRNNNFNNISAASIYRTRYLP